ncbi:serine/threonine-protein kinase [Candidatus Chloroploca asiatica]|uniref:non-specific serine/threonine protein kinase n=1 Tax=Candidatus Chloroploca asiatica TaxID=1506545 RepID=A0A2H3L0D7_9CHLR|nr:serine/threonine-protein kinase [Candidatus Chloroploca asiatica]PDV98110.1 hypothetical protein A9Q02_03245 [Candidatus Chloroploca asiatica]
MHRTSSPPSQIGQYRLLQQIGEGGLARVYLARHPHYGQVALKLPLAAVRRNRELERRFQTEARLLHRLHHPNILHVLETGAVTLPDEQTQYFIATEYLPDGSLMDLLQKGKLSEHYVLVLAVQIADALAYAHDRGVIHRDIKPSNLLMRGPYTVVLADFGIARPLAEETITQGKRVLGTLAYMSPEQTLGDRRLVRRGSDIYAFGLVLYEMLSGYQPRNNPNLPDIVVVQMIRQQPLPLLTQIAPHVSREFAGIIHRCLQPNRSQRYSTMHHVAQDLRSLAAHKGYALPSKVNEPVTTRTQQISWGWIVGIGTGIGMILLVIVLVLILQSG